MQRSLPPQNVPVARRRNKVEARVHARVAYPGTAVHGNLNGSGRTPLVRRPTVWHKRVVTLRIHSPPTSASRYMECCASINSRTYDQLFDAANAEKRSAVSPVFCTTGGPLPPFATPTSLCC